MKSRADLKTLVEKHIEFLKGTGAEISTWTIERPASETEIQDVERALGFPLQPKLRQVFGTLAKSIDFYWCNPDEDLEHDLYVAKGAVNWNLARLPRDLENAKGWSRNAESEWERVWASTLPVIDVGCGDYIGVPLGKSEPVIYLNHDAPDAHGETISPDFMTFIDEWGNLMFPGPDYGYWMCFLQGPDNYISSKGKVARDWPRWLAGELEE